jgi:hypothetical protein
MPAEATHPEDLGDSEDKILVASLGVEGGGLTVYGKRAVRGWTFWATGSSMELGENDDEMWTSWSSEPVLSLDLVLPEDWPRFHPLTIHPAFLPWFRGAYEKARASLSPDMSRSQEKHRHRDWLRIIGEGGEPLSGELPDKAITA